MLTLKQYQLNTLEALRLYFRRVVELSGANFRDPASSAFYDVTGELLGQGIPFREVPRLPGLPYVCLRIPTGGGKTLLGAHAVGLTAKEFLRTDYPTVLWLVPSDAIKDQTLAALENREHPYRQALDAAFGGHVTVIDLSAAFYVQRPTLENTATIIVSTLAALRVERMDSRKIYEAAGALQAHFVGLTPAQQDLLGPEPIPSLANVLRLHRPIVIMDEAHNARTTLSFEMLERFKPSCIIELTATPATMDKPEQGLIPSNILWHVSAAELQAEAMIKLPIELSTRTDWRQAIDEAIQLQDRLEKSARVEEAMTGEYIRPIVLLQAEPNRELNSITVDKIKECLVEEFRIPAEQVAIATGDQRELEDVNLFARDCPIRYIVTVYALREGWDCSFAYVLCSVADMTSKTAVEQLLGRVMRLPRAAPKQQADLNQAYAIAASLNWAQTANSLADALIASGFERFEIPRMISQPILPIGSPGRANPFVVTVSEMPNIAHLPSSLQQSVTYDLVKGELTFHGTQLTKADRDALAASFETLEGQAAAATLYDQVAAATMPAVTAAMEPRTISVPRLAYRVAQTGLLELFDETQFVRAQWNLGQYDHRLEPGHYQPIGDPANRGLIGLDENKRLRLSFVQELHEQLTLDVDVDWTVERLTNWLDRQIPHPDLTLAQVTSFIHRLLTDLVERRSIPLATLVRDKFHLRDAVANRIEEHRTHARGQSFQSILTGENVVVDESFSFTYPPTYPANSIYQGAYRFQRHLYPDVGELASRGEEHDCAVLIDSMPEVRWWVRNLAKRDEHSFWLPTSGHRFYPDFVALLKDGRLMVIEYKGGDRIDNSDSLEKDRVGRLWADRSRGKALFAMVNVSDMHDRIRSLMRSGS